MLYVHIKQFTNIETPSENMQDLKILNLNKA